MASNKSSNSDSPLIYRRAFEQQQLAKCHYLHPQLHNEFLQEEKDFSPAIIGSNEIERRDKNDSSNRREHSKHRSNMKQTLQNNNLSAQRQLSSLERLDCQETSQNLQSLLQQNQQQNQVLQSDTTENQGKFHLPRIGKSPEVPSTPFLGGSNYEIKDLQGDYQQNQKEVQNEEHLNIDSDYIENENIPQPKHQGQIQKQSKQVIQSEYPIFHHSSNTNHQIIHHNRSLKIKQSNERIEKDKRRCKQIGAINQLAKPPQTVNLNHNIPFQQILQGEQINLQALASSHPRCQQHRISSVESILQQTRQQTQQEQPTNQQQISRLPGQQEKEFNDVFKEDPSEGNQLQQCNKVIITEQSVFPANPEDPSQTSQQGNILICSNNSNAINDLAKPKCFNQIRRDSLCQPKQQSQGQQGYQGQTVVLPSRTRRLLF